MLINEINTTQTFINISWEHVFRHLLAEFCSVLKVKLRSIIGVSVNNRNLNYIQQPQLILLCEIIGEDFLERFAVQLYFGSW